MDEITKEIALTIDGREYKAREGETVLQAALRNGIPIPHLCYDPRLSPTGGCRLCIVEIEGERGLQTSCSREAADGMVIRTDTAELRKLRKATLELMASEHRLNCTTCDKDGDCLLQDYAYEYQIKEDRYPSIDLRVKQINYTSGNLAIQYDPTKCIRCQRCVKICAEVQGVEALTLRGRAGEMLVSTGFDVELNASTCELCGQCVSTCPTGALYDKRAVSLGKAKDMKPVRTTCPYCGVGCQLDLHIGKRSGQIVRVTSEIGAIPNDGNTCVKGRYGMDFVAKPDRLTRPLIRVKDKKSGTASEGSGKAKDARIAKPGYDHGAESGLDAFREATWEEALALVAQRFAELKKKHGSDALAGLSSAKTTNEDNYIMQKFVRSVLGTNNVDHCARLCHASTVAGLARAFGSGAMTNSIEELGRAPLIFVIGSNTTECHPVIGIMIRKAVAEGRTRLIVADPRKISLTKIADIHMQQRPGSDVALINALMCVILEEKLQDMDFIAQRTEGFEEMEEMVRACPPETAEKLTGVPADLIRQAARMYARAETASIVYSMGITQHTTGTDNVLSLANLAMLTGNVGKECAGVNPLRGQNNVQGACDLGALPNVYSGYQRVDDAAVREKFEKAWGASLSDKPGLTVVEIMNAAFEKTVRGLYVMGENPMISDPDVNHVEECLKSLDFLVVQDIFLTETARLADVVLPAGSFAEKDGTFTNTERRVQRVRAAVTPPGEAREDWRILCDVAERMGAPMTFNGRDYLDASDVMDEIAAFTPIYGGMSYDRLEEVGLQWPCPDSSHPGTKFLHQGTFSRGKGKFHPVAFLEPKELPDQEYPLILTTGRQLEHWHTGSMTRRCEVLDDLVPHGLLEMHPDDGERLGLESGELASVSSRRGTVQVPVKLQDKTRPGTVFLAFHFREHPANVLTIAALDPLAKIPEFKACAVKVEKIGC